MKEKNKVKPTSSQDDIMPSKGKITAAWLLLIVLLGCTAGLVYLKNFRPTESEIQEEEPETISPAIASVLNTIVDNFNANTLVNDYKEEGLTLIASLTDATITVSYANTDINGSINYTYELSTAKLSTTFKNADKEINDKIFKIMVLACRQRLNLAEDVTSKLDEFTIETIEAPGLTKEVTDTNTVYQIDIRYPLSEAKETTTSTTDTTTEPEENNNNENNQNTPTNDTASTNTENNTTEAQSSANNITSTTQVDDETTNNTTSQTTPEANNAITNDNNNTEDSNMANNTDNNE